MSAITIVKNSTMKHFIFISVLIISTLKLLSQDFAPIGSEWHYDEHFAFSSQVDYIKFTSEKDTLIYGEVCRKITKRHRLGCNDRPDVEFLFTRNDTVFFLDTVFNQFQILYDFSAESGDSWIVKVKDAEIENDTVFITVDSTSIKTINGFDLKALHVTYVNSSGEWPEIYNSTIVEKIGDLTYMFNWYPYYYGACDVNWTEGLRCYEDEEFGFYSTNTLVACDFTTSISELELQNSFEVSPNPSNGYIFVEVNCKEKLVLEVKDLNAKLLYSGSFISSTSVDLSKFQKGMYLVKIKQNGRLVGLKKVLIR